MSHDLLEHGATVLAPAVARAQQGSVRARSCRVSWLVQAVAVATAAARVTQGYARGGRK